MDNKIYLLTRGDDCGSSHSANRAIMEACNSGLLKNVSLMVVCPEIVEVTEFFAARKDICLGLHLTMNAEWDNKFWGPVLPHDRVPSLVDKRGAFFQSTMALYENKPPLEEIMAEIQAQLDRARALKFNISYAEMHMGFNWIDSRLDEEFDQWCRKEGIINGHIPYTPLPEVAVEGDPVEVMLERLKAATPGIYMLGGHPAYDDEEMRSMGNSEYPGELIARERDWDRRILTDARILDYCRDHNIVTVRYDEID